MLTPSIAPDLATQEPEKLPLIAILGPTGSGKTDLAVTLAEALQGEIINYDSVQVYRHLDVGSAKPTVAERRGIPHHLLDILEPNEELTAGAFARRATSVIAEVTGRGGLPILVGGTGFYLRALLDGLSPAPQRSEALRERFAAASGRKPGSLHRLLRRQDPDAAERIHPNDHQKLIRALELTALACRPASEIQAVPRQALQGYNILKLGLLPDRDLLKTRLDGRSARMFNAGLIEETKELLDSGVSPTAKPLQALGYKQAVAYLSGRILLNEAVRECQAKTRQYAKRQMTWFRGETGVHWLEGFGFEPSIQRQGLQKVHDSSVSSAV